MPNFLRHTRLASSWMIFMVENQLYKTSNTAACYQMKATSAVQISTQGQMSHITMKRQLIQARSIHQREHVQQHRYLKQGWTYKEVMEGNKKLEQFVCPCTYHDSCCKRLKNASSQLYYPDVCSTGTKDPWINTHTLQRSGNKPSGSMWYLSLITIWCLSSKR